MAILPILEFPDPRLRTRAQPVAAVDDRIRQLVDDMFETMYAAPGIGLAATQVNVHERVVVMDISMPGMNGIQATERLRQTCPEVKVLAMSVHDDTSYLRQMLAVGAAGYILKHTGADALIQAIRIVAAGGLYLEPTLAEHVVGRYVRRPAVVTELLGAALRERERTVVP